MAERLTSALGIFVLLGIAYAFSSARRKIPWRIVVVGILLQVYLALFLVRPALVPGVLTAVAGLCLLALFVPRLQALDDFVGIAARALGVSGVITALVFAGSRVGAGTGVHQLVLLAFPLALWALWRFRPRFRPEISFALSTGGCLAVVYLIWWGGLPGDFVYRALTGMGQGIEHVVGFAEKGAGFVFGGIQRDGFVFAIDVGAIILLFSALMSCLYHVGVLPWLVGLMARLLHKSMGVSGGESLAAAANVFVGQTEAPLVIRPYLPKMTRSEVMALMAGGFATIAGSVFGAYLKILSDSGFVRAGADLIAASVMSAPAAFVFAKLFVPETEQSETAGGAELTGEQMGSSLLDALAGGVTAGVRLAVNVAAMLLVFYALIQMLDGGVNWVAKEVFQANLTFKDIYAYLFAPFAFLMGVPASECWEVGRLIGTKTIFNEFFAYKDLGAAIQEGRIGMRAAILSTYALCGFANFMSIGIQIGGLGALAPGRRSDFARLALRAMVAGALACQLTACIVGVMGDF